MTTIESKSLLLSNLNKVLVNHLETTIEHIHCKYKKYFTEHDAKDVMEIITSNINFQDMEKDELELINKKITNKIVSRQIYNSGIYTNKHSIPEDGERCHARIWANGHLNLKEDFLNNDDNNQTNEDKSKNNNLDVDKNIIFGKRCSRKINSNCPNHKYCGHHMKNNPHGDYNSPLKKYQKQNFIKNSKLFNGK